LLWSVQKRWNIGGFTSSSAVSSAGRIASVAVPVQIAVGKEPVRGGVRYSYYVSNGGAFPIWNIMVGFDKLHDQSELFVRPAGYDPATDLVPTSVTSPRGWTASLEETEGDSAYALVWEVDTTLSPRPEILGGQSLGGFSIIVPREQGAFESGDWVVNLNASDAAYYLGRLKSR